MRRRSDLSSAAKSSNYNTKLYHFLDEIFNFEINDSSYLFKVKREQGRKRLLKDYYFQNIVRLVTIDVTENYKEYTLRSTSKSL